MKPLIGKPFSMFLLFYTPLHLTLYSTVGSNLTNSLIIFYWIYNLIRAVFFQNLNVYLRKTCTIVLFKVLSIWSYDFFRIIKELRRLGGQEWIKPIFDTLFWCEPYFSDVHSNMGPSVVMMENYCLVSGRIFRAFFGYFSLQTD